MRAARLALLAGVVLGCAKQPSPQANPAPVSPPDAIVGDFLDDYGERHTVSATQWFQQPRNRFHIVKWNRAGHYLIARNDSANAGERGLWTRIDWVELTGMPPFEVAFCFSAYKAVSAAAAESTTVARPETPRTGCNGFPYTRLRRAPR